MRKDIEKWNHSGGKAWKPYLSLFEEGKVSDTEYEHIKKNSSDNFVNHSESHYNPVRECLNKIYEQDSLVVDKKKLKDLDDNFLNCTGHYSKYKRVNFKSFLQRVSEYPIVDEKKFFESIINLDDSVERTKDFNQYASAGVYRQSLRILEIARKIREGKSMERIVFCRIASMKFYRGIIDEDKPKGGGTYSEENPPHERFNFMDKDGVIKGFVESGSNSKGMNLKRISPEAQQDDESLDKVLVIFVADNNIIGYYKDAKIYNFIQNKDNYDKGDHSAYNIEVQTSKAVLLSVDSRKYSIPKGKGAMGQSNVFYIYDDQGDLKEQKWIKEAINYVQINKLVKSYIPNIIEYCRSNSDELKNLTANKFGTTSYPLLKKVEEIQKHDENIEVPAQKMHANYYVKKYDINGTLYRFHSQWGGHKIWDGSNSSISLDEKHRNSFIDYLEEKNLFKRDDTVINSDIINNDKQDMKKPLNQILYGPPGTGKTYSTVGKALEILEATDEQKQRIKSIGQLKEEFKSQVEFVTFHQSFSYEDFVEGLKAESDDESKISYDVKPGVFKEICKNAKDNQNISKTIQTDSIDVELLTDDFFSYIEEKIEKGEKVILTVAKEFKKKTYFGKVIKNSSGDLKSLQTSGSAKHQTLTKEIVLRDYQLFCDGSIEDYKDIKPKFESRRNFHGNALYYYQLFLVIQKFQEEQKQDGINYLISKEEKQNKNYVLIIDEINRGNISRIFGELITLIEPSKRAGEDEEISVKLPYSKYPFSVPNNLYIIGTMNTADRSLALMDTALRRRFEFVEMMPDTTLIENYEGVDLQELLKTINQRIEVLYDREHTIGHSFLMGVDSLDKLKGAFKNKILPLLEEYFYDDWQKIRLVLNDDKAEKFYQKVEQNLFNDDEFNKTIYKRQNFDELDTLAFMNIYQQDSDKS